MRSSLPLEDLLQLRDNRVTHLDSTNGASKVLCPHTIVESSLNRGLDGSRLLGQVERIPQHHGDGEDSTDGVDDALAGDIRGGA